MDGAGSAITTPESAEKIFGEYLPKAVQFAELLRLHGVERGLIGPREIERLWDRHLLNSAVIAELMPSGARVIDVGSGAGLPGIPLAIARPDLDVVLVEPMARRVDWLNYVMAELKLPITVIRGRAEDREVLSEVAGADIVTARAVAPLAKLAGWCLPLAKPGGRMLALKGASVQDEIERDTAAIKKLRGSVPVLAECGKGLVDPPTIVAIVERLAPQSATRRQSKKRPPKDA